MDQLFDHELHCNVSRRTPVGSPGCSCRLAADIHKNCRARVEAAEKAIEVALDANAATKVLKDRISELNKELAEYKFPVPGTVKEINAEIIKRDRRIDRLESIVERLTRKYRRLRGERAEKERRG